MTYTFRPQTADATCVIGGGSEAASWHLSNQEPKPQ